MPPPGDGALNRAGDDALHVALEDADVLLAQDNVGPLAIRYALQLPHQLSHRLQRRRRRPRRLRQGAPAHAENALQNVGCFCR